MVEFRTGGVPEAARGVDSIQDLSRERLDQRASNRLCDNRDPGSSASLSYDLCTYVTG